MSYLPEADYGPNVDPMEYEDDPQDRRFCSCCVTIIADGNDPEWRCGVPCCFDCDNEVGDDRVEKDGIYHCKECDDSDAGSDTAGSEEE